MSRLEKFGTIFTRVQGLYKSGHWKDDNLPIWFKIYERFPPQVEPKFDRPEPEIKLRKIFYAEDVERAKNQKEIREKKEFHKQVKESISTDND